MKRTLSFLTGARAATCRAATGTAPARRSSRARRRGRLFRVMQAGRIGCFPMKASAVTKTGRDQVGEEWMLAADSWGRVPPAFVTAPFGTRNVAILLTVVGRRRDNRAQRTAQAP